MFKGEKEMKLKPCPFCGGETTKVEVRILCLETHYKDKYGCSKCDVWFETPEDDICSQPIITCKE